MTDPEASEIIAADKAHHWHPFTQMREWCHPEHDPLIITGGLGAWLTDQHGQRYLDGNSTIWTCIHGHRHPAITSAITSQLHAIAHVSALGFISAPAAQLAKALVSLWPENTLSRVFFSDDGSTAIECGLKIALQYFQLTGQPQRRRFASFSLAYHGDTMGAASLGGIAAYHERFRGLGCDALLLASLEELTALPAEAAGSLAAVVIEPLIQGAAGMRLWPADMLPRLRAWCHTHGVLLIADEVMTGFGRTGKMFACEHSHVVPDIIALAKGLTGGFLPLAATMTTEPIFAAFLGSPEEHRTFYYGHSYSGNPLGCAAALANLATFASENTLDRIQPLIPHLAAALEGLARAHPQHVSAIRQCGLIAGIDVVNAGGLPYPPALQTGARICVAARKYGLLTRPVRDTLVFMPPLCITREEISAAIEALRLAIHDVCLSS
jgi:adenosylmethionine-8-amino-7-oxononanoate aminotransferase